MEKCIIVAIADNNAIGRDNALLWHISEDMKFFRETTTGKVVVMGRKTLESFPHGRPLKNRVNIVLTSDRTYQAEGAVIVHSIDELMELVKGLNSDEVFVIGGAMVYSTLMPYCEKLYITHIDRAFDADRFLPEIKDSEWEVLDASETMEENGLSFRYVTYVRKK